MQKDEIKRRLILILNVFKEDAIEALDSTHENFSIDMEETNKDILDEFGFSIKIYSKVKKVKIFSTVEPVLFVELTTFCEVKDRQELLPYSANIEIINPDSKKDVAYILEKINPELIKLRETISNEFKISEDSIKIKNNIVKITIVKKFHSDKNWIILPGNDKVGNSSYPTILISIEKFYFHKNWDECQELLYKNGEFMLTVRQFVDFLNLLISGDVKYANGEKVPKKEAERILNEIIGVENIQRGEWLDARFIDKERQSYIVYHKVNAKGQIAEITEPLNCLIKVRTPGIDLNSWLETATYQGLPLSDIKNGSLYYWSPKKNCVARFWADSYCVHLFCDWNPTSSNDDLGVRRAKILGNSLLLKNNKYK